MKLPLKIKRLIPRVLLAQIGFFITYSRLWGHSHQLQGICVDGKGNPLPWISYSAIEFLNTIDFSEARVFEFGAGSSTLWWANRAKLVCSVEREKDWFERLIPILPDNANVALEQNELMYPYRIADHRCKFDVVVIDGAVRYPCVQSCLDYLDENGIILLDNTEWYPNIANMLNNLGFSQVDFVGFGPINAFPSSSTIFFRGNKWLTQKKKNSRWTPIGGRWLKAHDDCPLSEIDDSLLRK